MLTHQKWHLAFALARQLACHIDSREGLITTSLHGTFETKIAGFCGNLIDSRVLKAIIQ